MENDNMDRAAILKAKKIGAPDGWEPFLYEAVDSGMLITGAVLRTITRGPNKGRKTARGCPTLTVVVTREEIDREDEVANVCTKEENSWRRLALQFDNHRMQALAYLKRMLVDPVAHAHEVEEFLKAGPLSGITVLEQRLRTLATTTSSLSDLVAEQDIGNLRRIAQWITNDKRENSAGYLLDIAARIERNKKGLQALELVIKEDGTQVWLRFDNGMLSVNSMVDDCGPVTARALEAAISKYLTAHAPITKED